MRGSTVDGPTSDPREASSQPHRNVLPLVTQREQVLTRWSRGRSVSAEIRFLRYSSIVTITMLPGSSISPPNATSSPTRTAARLRIFVGPDHRSHTRKTSHSTSGRPHCYCDHLFCASCDGPPEAVDVRAGSVRRTISSVDLRLVTRVIGTSLNPVWEFGSADDEPTRASVSSW